MSEEDIVLLEKIDDKNKKGSHVLKYAVGKAKPLIELKNVSKVYGSGK